jgi:hypothetical protein
MRRIFGRGIGLGMVTVALLVSGGATGTAYASSPCNLGPGGSIHHVVYVQFDNFHLQRDNANVPSDLEQIPALKSFLTSNGTLDSNDHTILISHTAGGIMSSLTGLYPDRNGVTVSNSYGVFKPDGSIDTPNASAFTYWTDPVTASDQRPNLITDGQKNTPAPWTPYTKAGCDVGAFSIADLELENTKTTGNAPDITTVFGNPSHEASFASGPATSAQKVADFEGIAVHCSQADSQAGGLCQTSNGGRPDVLPDEPGGYTGFNGLFGAAYANQVVSNPGTFTASTQDANGTAAGFNDVPPPVNDVFDFSHTATPATCTVNGGACPTPTPIASGSFNGFPNSFNPSAAQTLGYTAAMQEAGIPVTMAYIADAHDRHDTTGACSSTAPVTGFLPGAQGPGAPCYEQQLQEYDQAFQAYFQRLAADGINKSNTLFVFTVEEGDHFAGGQPTNAASCDGVHAACTYTSGTSGPNTVGEIQANLQDLVQKETGNSNAFDYHFDDAPTVYVHNDPNGVPGPTNSKVRSLERDMAGLTAGNPRTGNQDTLLQHIADQPTQDILHMTNTDPLRTPSFTFFGNPDYFFQSQNCSATAQAGCPNIGTGFAWNHGDDNPEIAKTWLGLVGPDVQNLGQTGSTWTDHTDVVPTMLAALGLSPSYNLDGDAYTQALSSSALPANVQNHLATFQGLTAALKQLNAPFGQFGHDAEVVSTTAVQTTRSDVYNGWESQLNACKTQRNTLAGQMQSTLNGATFGGGSIDDTQANAMIAQTDQLIGNMHALSLRNNPPDFTICGSSDVAQPGAPGQNGQNGQSGGSGRVRGAHGKRCKKHAHARHRKRSRRCKK